MKLYIDPGTGSMLFSLALGLISVLWFGLRGIFMKLKYISPGKVKADTSKKDFIIYGEDKRYWTTFKSICDEFEKRGIDVTYLAGSEDDPILSEHYTHVETDVIGLGNKAFARLNFLKARIVLSTTPGLDVYQWKRSKDVEWYAHITHSIGGGIAYKMFGTQFYDAVLFCSDVFAPAHRKLEKMRNSKPKELVIVGQTYMDRLMKIKSDTITPQHEGINVLLAPSWGPKSILNRFGEQFIRSLIDTGFNITLRPHPQSYISEKKMINELKEKFPETDRFHWNTDSDNFDVLSKSDILISDYSGVIYDYSFIFERPVIFSGGVPNTADQDEYWLDTPYCAQEIIQKVAFELTDENKDDIASIIKKLVNDKEFHQTIKETRDKYWQYQGLAAQKVVDYLVNKKESLKQAE